MNTADEAIDGLAAQEVESLAACVSRNQPAESYQDIIEKIRGHCVRLPKERQFFWAEQCKVLGVDLFPAPVVEDPVPTVEDEGDAPTRGKRKKSGGSSTP